MKYREEVLSIIPKNIMGMGEWYSRNITNPADRKAYLGMIESCTRIVSKHDLGLALDTLRAILESLVAMKKDSVAERIQDEWDWTLDSFYDAFSSDPISYQMIAITQAIELCLGIEARFLNN